MTTKTRTSAAPSVDRVFRAFSDRTRLRILNLLRGRDELCVCDLITVLKLPQAKVSRHLAYLRKAGLVAARKEGLWVHYRLLPASGAFHAKMLECLNCCLAEVPELNRDRETLKKCGCSSGVSDAFQGGCCGD